MSTTEAEFRSRFEAALPIEDLVAWLIAEYPAASEREIMGLLQRVYGKGYKISPAASEERAYRVGDNEWNAYPQRVATKLAD